MSSAGNITVKVERHDEAEIVELAAKFTEQHKQQNAKTIAAQQLAAANRAAASGAASSINNHMPNSQFQTNQMYNSQSSNNLATIITANGTQQASIMNYLTRKPTHHGESSVTIEPANNKSTIQSSANSSHKLVVPVSVSSPPSSDVLDASDERNKMCDEESQRGHFGWAMFGKIYIPYILRQSEKYCAVRIIELRLLNKYLHYLHQDIYSCTCVRSYYITEAESRLLNEINHKHCDGQFGRDMFTQKDLVVRLGDANKFYHFLDVCYKKLVMGSTGPADKCGFIRINKESVVPYTVRDKEKYVPLFYFEGETDNLKLKADYLSGWDLSYLKFCCKVQGIRNELFASDQVAVISLMDIKSYFPSGTEFEDYWPSKVVESTLLISTKQQMSNGVHWTRQPTAPPPKIVSVPALSSNVQSSPAIVNGAPVSMLGVGVGNTGHTINSINGSGVVSGGNGGVGTMTCTSSKSGAQSRSRPGVGNTSNAALSMPSASSAANANSAYNAAVAMQQSAAALSAQQSQRTMQHNPMAAAAAAAAVNPSITNVLQAALAAGASGWPGISANTMLSPEQTQQVLRMAQAQAQFITQQQHQQQQRSNSSRSSTAQLRQHHQQQHQASRHQQQHMAYAQLQQLAQQQGNALDVAAVAAAASVVQNPPHVRSNGQSSAAQSSHLSVLRQQQQHHQNSVSAAAMHAQHLQHQQRLDRNTTLTHLNTAQQPHHQQNSRSGLSSPNGSGSLNGTIGVPTNMADVSITRTGMHVIPDVSTSGPHAPYRMQRVTINNVKVPCINMRAYLSNEMLMSLSDLNEYFFPDISLDTCKRVVSVLRIELYKCNRQQALILRDNGHHNPDVPLVLLNDVLNFMPQLQYMIESQRQHDQPSAKRSRWS